MAPSQSSALPTSLAAPDWAAPLPLPPLPLPPADDSALAAGQLAAAAAQQQQQQQEQEPRKRKAAASFADLQHRPAGCFAGHKAAPPAAKRPAAGMPSSGSQLSLLLSAIEACERTAPGEGGPVCSQQGAPARQASGDLHA